MVSAHPDSRAGADDLGVDPCYFFFAFLDEDLRRIAMRIAAPMARAGRRIVLLVLFWLMGQRLISPKLVRQVFVHNGVSRLPL